MDDIFEVKCLHGELRAAGLPLSFASGSVSSLRSSRKRRKPAGEDRHKSRHNRQRRKQCQALPSLVQLAKRPEVSLNSLDPVDPARVLPFPVMLSAAPMVGASDLAFRLLCRRHGTTLCYTEMLYSDRVVSEDGYLDTMLKTCAEDHPLVVQLCGHDVTTLIAAAKLCESRYVSVAMDPMDPGYEVRLQWRASSCVRGTLHVPEACESWIHFKIFCIYA